MFLPWLKRVSVLCLILLLQGPVVLTQEIGWVQMLISYSWDRGVARGVVETFDGDHPCPMCHKAEELSQAKTDNGEQKDNQPEQSLRLMLSWGKAVEMRRIRIADLIGADHPFVAWLDQQPFSGRDRAAPVTPPPQWG